MRDTITVNLGSLPAKGSCEPRRMTRIQGRSTPLWKRGATGLVLLAVLFIPSAWSQINTGKITVAIEDQSRASVPGVEVRAINEETDVVTNAVASEAGSYLVNFLVPGKYRVEAVKPGFQTAIEKGVVVNAGSIARVDCKLQVGEVKQTVEVSANAIAVATESSELSVTFSQKELVRLPNIDRNPLYQLNLMPGANNGSGSGNYWDLGGENPSAIGQSRAQFASIGGVDANANSVLIEGAPNREPQNATISQVTPIEGIQEVQVYTGKYNAEFGFSGSALVNIVTKSGTNDFHGAVFEYLRNNATDARDFFAVGSNPFRRNQFGAAIGGPIKKNKLFFFANYQGTYFRRSGTGITSAPTEKMIDGDFSELYVPGELDNAGNTLGQLYDPYTRVFDADGNVIGADLFPGNIIPRARWDAVAAKMNDAFLWGKPNQAGIENNLYYLSSHDQHVHQADGRVDFNSSEKNRFFVRYSIQKAFNDQSTNINQFWQEGGADSLSQNQNGQFTFMRTFSPSKMNEFRLSVNRTRIVTSNKSMGKDWNNEFGITNGNLGDPSTRGLVEITGLSPLHDVGDPDWVAFIRSTTLSLVNNFTWVKGSHTMKFGTDIRWVADTSADTMGGDSPRGRFFSSPTFTSYDGLNVRPYAYPSLLLGLLTESNRAMWMAGLPYQTYWQNAWYAQDDFKLLPSLTLNLGFRYELSTRPIERFDRQANWDENTNQLILATKDNRSPALALDKGDVGPRVGFAWSPDKGKTSLRGGFGMSYWQAYWAGPLTVLGMTYPFYGKSAFVNGSELTPNLTMAKDGLPIPKASYDGAGNLVIPENAVIRGTDKQWKNQRTTQVSFNLQREIRPGLIADVGYLKVNGAHLLWWGDNLNYVPPGPPNEDYTLRRPLRDLYPQIGDLPFYRSVGSTWYDAVTARLTGNVTRGLTLNATYTHGRSFANMFNINPKDLNQYYGPDQQDIAHLFAAQVNYEIPVGRGKKYWTNLNPVLNHILGGWQYSAFLTFRSGTRFTPDSGVSTLNNGQGNRPDRIKDGNLPPSQRTIEKWFDTTAFVDHTEQQTYGNCGTNPLVSDGVSQLDSSIFKQFKFKERHALEFRVDIFNTFNHPDFGYPDAYVGSSSMGQITYTITDPRRFQFGLRYSF